MHTCAVRDRRCFYRPARTEVSAAQPGEGCGELQKDQIEALFQGSSGLHETTVKLALAMRLGWDRLAGDDGWGPAGAMKLLGIVLSDLILLREAEVQRRYKMGQKPGG